MGRASVIDRRSRVRFSPAATFNVAAVAQKKTFLRSCRHIISQDCGECRWNYIVNVKVPGSSPGDVGNDVVAQLAEHHDKFHQHLSSQYFRMSSAPAGARTWSAPALQCNATNAGGNYIGIRRSSGVSPGMRQRISSGESAGHRFPNHLSSHAIFETWPADAGPNKEAHHGQETTTRRRLFSTTRPASVAEASPLRQRSNAGCASSTATKS